MPVLRGAVAYAARPEARYALSVDQLAAGIAIAVAMVAITDMPAWGYLLVPFAFIIAVPIDLARVRRLLWNAVDGFPS